MQAAKKRNNWIKCQSAKNVNKMCFCALFRLSNYNTLDKNAIFRWC